VVYRLRAPNRMAYRTRRSQEVVVGKAQWFRTTDSPWTRSPYGSGIPFSVRAWFRWTPYARAVRELRRDRRTTELALMDPATPVWLRLVVDNHTGRVLRERMSTRGHFMQTRYFAFNQRLSITPPNVR
jgi:hypothetical protein